MLFVGGGEVRHVVVPKSQSQADVLDAANRVARAGMLPHRIHQTRSREVEDRPVGIAHLPDGLGGVERSSTDDRIAEQRIHLHQQEFTQGELADLNQRFQPGSGRPIAWMGGLQRRKQNMGIAGDDQRRGVR